MKNTTTLTFDASNVNVPRLVSAFERNDIKILVVPTPAGTIHLTFVPCLLSEVVRIVTHEEETTREEVRIVTQDATTYATLINAITTHDMMWDADTRMTFEEVCRVMMFDEGVYDAMNARVEAMRASYRLDIEEGA